MKTTAELINVSTHILPYLFYLNFDSTSGDSQAFPNQFLKVPIKRMQQTKTFEDELKEATKMNLIFST
jgi:hypothetical protein